MPRRIHKVQLFEEDSVDISLVPYETVLVKAQPLLDVAAPSLLPFELESGEGTLIYNHRG